MVDWSTLMTELLRYLGKAEEDLRLQHVDIEYVRQARSKLVSARRTVILLEEWCNVRDHDA